MEKESGSNKSITLKTTDYDILDLDKSLSTITKLENLVEKFANSTFADSFKETVYDKDADGNTIESTKRVVVNKSDMVVCLALGFELGIPPITALSYGKGLNLKSIMQIEKGKK